MPKLCVKGVDGKGRCVFAGEAIAEGQTIDTNCVLTFPQWQAEELKPPLQFYPFEWDKDFVCIPLGSLSLANHSSDPNAFLQRDGANFQMRLVAKRDIEAGEEITYDYKVPLWFEPKPPSRLNMEKTNGTSS